MDAFQYIGVSKQPAVIFQIRDGLVTTLYESDVAAIRRRLDIYYSFFQSVVKSQSLDLDLTFAMALRDTPFSIPGCPIFSFQRSIGSRHILVPDIDFLATIFYSDNKFNDVHSYGDKFVGAVFVGSTTGTDTVTGRDIVNTIDVVREGRNPRIKSGQFFLNDPLVIFRLPNIVQCDSEQTSDFIRQLGFEHGRMSWEEQLRYRFLISMDGNGATCSRVALSLRSNSVLLKYDSPFELFYFSELVPWKHYVPIHSDADVDDIVRAEIQAPNMFREIAENGTMFYEDNLTQEGCHAYTAAILRGYQELWQSEKSRVSLVARSLDNTQESTGGATRAVAHISGRGDIHFESTHMIGIPQSKLAIEGLSLILAELADPSEIRYQVLFKDGNLSNWCKGPDYCGTRGRGMPVTGFRAQLTPSAAERYTVLYSASFVDQQQLGPFSDGEMCECRSNSPIETLQITLESRQDSVTSDACSGSSGPLASSVKAPGT